MGQAGMDTQFYYWVTVTFAAVVAGFVAGDRLTWGSPRRGRGSLSSGGYGPHDTVCHIWGPLADSWHGSRSVFLTLSADRL